MLDCTYRALGCTLVAVSLGRFIKTTHDVVERELSGDRAREHVAQIGRFYRSPGSSGYHATVDYIIDSLKKGCVDHRIDEFSLDGLTKIGGEVMPLAWEPNGGTLELVGKEPSVLIRWDECGSCLPWWCPPTPPEGVELELVDVGTGERDKDYVGKQVEGRAVLLHDSGESSAWPDLVERAVGHGALGIVTNYLLFKYAPWRTREGLPEAVQQLRLPPRHQNPWVFTVSQGVFEQLHRAVEAGSAVVRFTVDAKTFESTSRSVLAMIPGRVLPEEGVLFVAHVSAATKPGANCASGVALLLEIASSLRRLIDSGHLSQPKRTIYFLFANEELGSLALDESHPELSRNLLGAFAFCSVGHDQAKTKSALIAGRSPDALPTFLNELIESLVEWRAGELPWAHFRQGSREIPYVRWKVQPYTPWSDNATWSKLGVPALLFMSLPDRYFHTQLLTVEETDPLVFESCGTVTGTAGYVAAEAGWPEAGEVMRRVVTRSEARLERIALQDRDGLGRTVDALAYVVDRDVASMRSTLELVPTEAREAAEALADRLERRLREKAALLNEELGSNEYIPTQPSPGDPAALVPQRTEGKVPHGVVALSYPELVALTEEMASRDPTVTLDSLRLFTDELWNLSTGQRSLGEIARAIGHEFGFDVAPEHMVLLAQGLERRGYLELPAG
jgi:hypothetical protein